MMTGRCDKNEEKQTLIHCIDFHSIDPVKLHIGLLNAECCLLRAVFTFAGTPDDNSTNKQIPTSTKFCIFAIQNLKTICKVQNV